MLVWIIATEADMKALPVGVPLALAAAMLSVALTPRTLTAIYIPGALRFVRFFAVQSVLGGVDVALRALRPSMPLEPAIVRYPLRIADTWPRVFFANTISMLPGTLSSRLDNDAIEVHVLDCTRPVIRDLADVEERVADLFGANLPPLEDGDAA
jgi:multicomponent Na+:H+ antiporter subunit E